MGSIFRKADFRTQIKVEVNHVVQQAITEESTTVQTKALICYHILQSKSFSKFNPTFHCQALFVSFN